MQNRDAAVFQALLTKQGWWKYGPYVYEVLWPGTELTLLFGHMTDLHQKVDTDLSLTDILAYLESAIVNEKQRTSLVELATKLGKINVTDSVIHECVNQFISRQLALKAATLLATGHTKPDFEPVLQEAQELLNSAVMPRIQPARVMDLMGSGLPDYGQDRPNLCGLGLGEDFDRAIGGGVAAGEILLILAAPKKGKTSVLRHIGLHQALRGKKVLDITIELNKEMAARRYDSALTGLDYEGLVANHKMIEDARQRIVDAGGSVQLVDWQYEEHSPSEIISLVEQYGPIDVLILDYLQLMIPDHSKAIARREQRHLYSKLGQDMRSVVKRLGIPCITAWQVNREGAQADQVTEHHVNECWAIVQHADILIGLSCSSEEKRNNILRIHTILSRFSEKQRELRFYADLERNKLERINYKGLR